MYSRCSGIPCTYLLGEENQHHWDNPFQHSYNLEKKNIYKSKDFVYVIIMSGLNVVPLQLFWQQVPGRG